MDIGDDLIALAIGADVGLQERRNNKMYANGVRPSFWQRHPLLPYVIGVLCVPLVPVAIALLVGYVCVVVWVDQHLGNTGVIDVLGLLWPFLFFGIRGFLRAERRQPDQQPIHVGLVVHWDPNQQCYIPVNRLPTPDERRGLHHAERRALP